MVKPPSNDFIVRAHGKFVSTYYLSFMSSWHLSFSGKMHKTFHGEGAGWRLGHTGCINSGAGGRRDGPGGEKEREDKGAEMQAEIKVSREREPRNG